MSVLRYIHNLKSRFHTFVANRLEVILEVTKPEQWKYGNTKVNPADTASRGMKASHFQTNTAWLNGPDFLWKTERGWPKQEIDISIPDSDCEIKETVNTLITEPNYDILDKLMTRYSDWMKLKRVVCGILIFFDLLKGRCDKAKTETKRNLIMTDLFKRSEKCIIRYIQKQHFADEIDSLSSDSKKTLKKTSKLYKLDPYIDYDGILRVGGRLDRAEIPYDMKHPIILPKNSNISMLIINDIHRAIGHLGRNSILSELRKRYWIIGASSLTKRMLLKCVTCRRYQGPLLEQKMADLPAERLQTDKHAFSMVGVDFFGPFYIKQRRSTVKRYGMIFTCMSVRAVHLEIVHSMDTDSCVNAIRRFIVRRGVPELIRSDNGTNLIGAEREMREEILRWNIDKIESFMTQNCIRWEFNPPSASHFGGIWERLIRSVRKILYSVIKEQNIRLDDEGLMTFMCEVESILNNRPLTDIFDSGNDINVPTPNHLLLLRPGEYVPPGTFCKTDSYVRRRWRQIQYLTDLFWRRWTSEYIPSLQKRQKWINEKRNVEIDDVVIIQDNCPRNYWNLGRIIEVFKNNDGFVRSAKLKTATTTLTRPIAKLCMLVKNDQ